MVSVILPPCPDSNFLFFKSYFDFMLSSFSSSFTSHLIFFHHWVHHIDFFSVYFYYSNHYPGIICAAVTRGIMQTQCLVTSVSQNISAAPFPIKFLQPVTDFLANPIFKPLMLARKTDQKPLKNYQNEAISQKSNMWKINIHHILTNKDETHEPARATQILIIPYALTFWCFVMSEGF